MEALGLRIMCLLCCLLLVSAKNNLLDECNHTRYPSLCVETLLGYDEQDITQHVHVVSALINRTMSEIKFNYESHFHVQESELQLHTPGGGEGITGRPLNNLCLLLLHVQKYIRSVLDSMCFRLSNRKNKSILTESPFY